LRFYVSWCFFYDFNNLPGDNGNLDAYRVSLRAVEAARGEKVGKEDLEDLQDPGAPREGQAHAALPQ
jgi:hypothetical protein